MSSESMRILMTLERDSLETNLALHCAPVISGLKISNLLIVGRDELAEVYRMFDDTGVSMFLLSKGQRNAVVLLYRENALEEYLRETGSGRILAECGHYIHTVREVLPALRRRYSEYMHHGMEFPHELGIVLGYPAEDVAGFIEHSGQNYVCNGYWKVYGNPEAARKAFDAYDSVRDTALKLVASGRSVIELTYGAEERTERYA